MRTLLLAAAACGLVLSASRADEPRRPPEGRRDVPEARRDGEGRDILCVAPLKQAPEADLLSALEKVFGKQLKVTVDKDAKLLVLQGPEAAVAGAVQALKDAIDPTPPRDPRGREGGEAGRAIDVVRLYRAKPDAVAKLVKQYVSDKVEMTERPNVPAIIFEGEASVVAQAASLARQIDGQMMHPSLRRIIGGGDRDER